MIEVPNKFENHIEIKQADLSAVDVLSDKTGLSKQKIKQIMQQGAVWLTDGQQVRRLRRAKKMLSAGQILHIYYDRSVLEQVPPAAQLIADLGAYSVWDKPSGMLSQGSKWGDHCTITRWAEQILKPERVSFAVHRLDRATRGLIIVAHEKKATTSLSSLFHDRQIDKRYCAVVAGKFAITSGRTRLRIDADIEGRHAVSIFSVLAYDAQQDQSILSVSIETGRKHQIRRHLADLGYPIIGDRLYGTANSSSVDLKLTASYLAFDCPLTGKPQQFELKF